MHNLKEIVHGILETTGINVVNNDSRKSDDVDAKRVYSLLASHTFETWEGIGRHVHKSHSLMMHHKQKGLDYLQTDKAFKKLYSECIKTIEKFKSEPYIKQKITELESETIKYKRILQNIKIDD